MNKSLNQIETDIVENGILSDEDIEAFREIDTMMSVTTLAWATKVCHEAVVRLKENKSILYNGIPLTEESFKNLLNDNLSDFFVRRIYTYNS